jgi:predicted enzyme related to lactoylglutathione lyase
MEVLFASVPVADLDEVLGWYERLFGRTADIVPNENEVMWRVAGNGWLYVIEDHERAGRTVVTISVSDLDQLVGELASRGIATEPIEAVGDAGRKANLLDPDGNMISWIQVVTSGPDYAVPVE